MTTDADKIRYLAELAGWHFDPKRVHQWHHPAYGFRDLGPDYPHSLDAIAHDLFPLLLWERGWRLDLWLDPERCQATVYDKALLGKARYINADDPARAAFESIWQALNGGEE